MKKLSLLILFFSLLISSACGPKVEIITINEDYSLRRIIDQEEKFALYRMEVPMSKNIYEGRFEPCNLRELRHGEYMFTLFSGGKKYLYDGYYGKLHLNGDPYIRFDKDNAGDLCFVTEKGIHPNNTSKGLPFYFEEYYSIRNYYIYRKGSKWGVYQQVYYEAEGSSLANVKYEYLYVETLPAVYDNILAVVSDNRKDHEVNHFVVNKGGNWSILDLWGRQRYMEYKNFGKLRCDRELEFIRPTFDDTYPYINHIKSLKREPTGYSSYLRHSYRYSGCKESGAFFLDALNTLNQAFDYHGDRTVDTPYPSFFQTNGPGEFSKYSISR